MLNPGCTGRRLPSGKGFWLVYADGTVTSIPLGGGTPVVLASGQVLRLGGKLRKRASGYRLAQLFIGSEGTLGIVTEVTVKLVPHPRHRATAMVGFATVEDAARAVSRVLAAGHFPAALEIMDRGAMRLVSEPAL